ncbi:MAG: histidine phosphatase family protein [Lachnospiraceae bacterium]|nr:histidine phosphatase family protein [Lachnospiraceae bacterium]
MKEIYLIRHGETPGNEGKKYIGITDEGLSDVGRSGLSLNKYPKADIIFSSPKKRCLETCTLIYPKKEIIVVEDLRETDFGEFEGKGFFELKDDPRYQEWLDSDGTMPFPSGESREEVRIRVMKAFIASLSLIKDGKTAAFIVHGGTIMTILSELFDGDFFDYQVKNGMGYSFVLSYDGAFSGLSSRSFAG